MSSVCTIDFLGGSCQKPYNNNVGDEQLPLPFSALFDDVPQSEDLVLASLSVSKTCFSSLSGWSTASETCLMMSLARILLRTDRE